MVRTPPDAVDRIIEQWATERPDVDSSPLAIIGRVSRLSRLIDRQLAESFGRFGLHPWMYDILATLRRSGPPHELTAGQLVEQSMVTTGAITNRIDKLELQGLVERTSTFDRRKVVVRLTAAGLELVDMIVEPHMEVEEEILSVLSPRQRNDLVRSLRTLLLHLGDDPPRRS